LQDIAGRGIEQYKEAETKATREDWCRHQLLGAGVQGARAEAIIGRVALAIKNCLGSDRGRWLLSQHESGECEYALTAVLDHSPKNLVLDRTFVDNGIRWIIDYKTSSHAGGDLEGFLRNEADRYREQLQQYRQAMALDESRPIRTALYFPLLDRFLEV